MKNGVKNSTFRVAFCGIIAALALALMLLTSLVPIGTYAFPCFSGIFIAAVVIEYGWKWGLGVYAVVSVLSLFLAGDKEAVLYFIALFGYYPILKSLIERINKNLIEWILKLLVFNTAAVTSYFIMSFIFSISFDDFGILGEYGAYIFLAICNVVFVIYDIGISRAASFYIFILHDKVKKIIK